MVNPGIGQNCSTIFPFNFLSSIRNFLACCTNTDKNITQWKDLGNDHNSWLSLKPPNLELLVNQFNHATPENSNDPGKISAPKYYDIEELYNIEIPHKNKLLSLFHINACSLNKNLYDHQHVLSCTKIFWDNTNKWNKNHKTTILNILNLNNYSFEFTPTKTSAGGTLLYIANHWSYKYHNDLNIYKKWTGIYF